MDFQTLINIAQDYWGIISTVLGFIGYALVQRENAKKIILSLMLRLEKEAESLALTTGDDKLEFMLEKGYALLPANVRLFVPQATFNDLAESLYKKAKSYLIVHQAKTESIPVENVNAPSPAPTSNVVVSPLDIKDAVTQFTIEASQQAVDKVLKDITDAINNSVKVNR